MLVPVLPGDGKICDVRLLGIVLGVAVRLRRAGHGRRLRNVLRVDGELAGDRLVGRHVVVCERGGAKVFFVGSASFAALETHQSPVKVSSPRRTDQPRSVPEARGNGWRSEGGG